SLASIMRERQLSAGAVSSGHHNGPPRPAGRVVRQRMNHPGRPTTTPSAPRTRPCGTIRMCMSGDPSSYASRTDWKDSTESIERRRLRPMEVIWKEDFRARINTWLPVDEIEQGAMQQLENVARHPEVADVVAAMPDMHVGYGVPIGCVFPTVDAVVPN